MHSVIKLLVQAYSNAILKAVSILYRLTESRMDSTLYVKARWERELGEEIPEKMWYDMWKTHQPATQSLRWREFGWRNQICYFIMP